MEKTSECFISISRAARLLLREVEATVQFGALKARLPSVQRVARYIPFHGTDVADLSWIEIDFPGDLVAAEQKVWSLAATRRKQMVCRA